jgi:hypothetical protein
MRGKAGSSKAGSASSPRVRRSTIGKHDRRRFRQFFAAINFGQTSESPAGYEITSVKVRMFELGRCVVHSLRFEIALRETLNMRAILQHAHNLARRLGSIAAANGFALLAHREPLLSPHANAARFRAFASNPRGSADHVSTRSPGWLARHAAGELSARPAFAKSAVRLSLKTSACRRAQETRRPQM